MFIAIKVKRLVENSGYGFFVGCSLPAGKYPWGDSCLKGLGVLDNSVRGVNYRGVNLVSLSMSAIFLASRVSFRVAQKGILKQCCFTMLVV